MRGLFGWVHRMPNFLKQSYPRKATNTLHPMKRAAPKMFDTCFLLLMINFDLEGSDDVDEM